ncbi:MAG: endonuclease III domain-containing protein [Pseudomonadota bacterium]
MPWWPAGFARTPTARAFEIAVGAVLTQNTNWRNVERAMANLERDQALDAAIVRALPDETLAELIRPSGFYRIKTGRLKALAIAWEEAGGYPALARWDTTTLRDWLLGIHGVGRETADDILLYGFARSVWVIDAYTRRLIGRLGFEELAALSYDELAAHLLAHTNQPTAERLAAWHGLIVEHAKAFCRMRPVCVMCPLQTSCAHGRQTGVRPG